MFPTPSEYETIMAGARNIWYEGTITTVAGDTYTFDTSNIVSGTGSVNRRITDGTSLAIGSVTAAQFDVKLFWTGIDRYELYDAKINVSCFVGKPETSYVSEKWSDVSTKKWSELTSTKWEQLQGAIEFPIGEFFVNEVTQDATTVSITAYDALLRFDVNYVHTVANKTPYEWLDAWCYACGVKLGTTEAQIRSMPNGIRKLSCDVDSVSDISTYRDVLSYLCTVLCAVAVIGRDGLLYIQNYGTTAAKTFDQSQRYSSTLSDYVCYYTHMVSVYGETIENYTNTSYSGADDGITLDIDVNPFLQIANETTRHAACQAILDKLAAVHYAPYEVSLPTRPELDIMDVVKWSGGQAGTQDFGAIMDITYNFDSPMSLECAGDNPKTIKDNKYVKTIKSVSRASKQNDDFSGLLANAYGMYRTEIEDPVLEGAYTYALHNEKTYEQSTFAMVANADGLYLLTRDSVFDEWTITSSTASDGSAFVEVLTANMAIINSIFSQDITVSGALHSEDYIPAVSGASPPYSRGGMGLDFGEKEFEGENFAIDANGKLYANGAEFTGAEITGGRITLTDAGGSNPNLRIYKETDPDNYGTVIGSTSWLKEWYDPNDTAHWYYYAWRFYNGEMTGGVADDVQRMSINWQKGTIKASGSITSDFGDIYSGGDIEAEGTLTLGTPLTIANGGTGASTRLNAFKNLTNAAVASPNYVVGFTSNWAAAGYTSLQQLRNASGLGNTTGALPIANGGTGATDRLNAFKNLTNQNVGANATHFVTLTTSWATAGYSTVADACTALGIKCTRLWNGTLTSGSITFTYGGYNAYIVMGKASASSFGSVTIPAPSIGTSDSQWQIADDASYIVFKIKYSGSTGTVTFVSRQTGSSAQVNYVFGIK